MITLDIFADPVCPWCLIGKARLERALAARPDHTFLIAWHPFQLNPSMPEEGMSRAAYLEAKFGREATGKLLIPVLEAAQEAGVEMDVTGLKHMPNTLNAHRLLYWAGIEGRQGPVMNALMSAFWQEGRDIGSHAVLIEIAEQAGMDAAMIAQLLASQSDRDTVLARDAHARERGVRAVPTFVLGNTHVVEGAQPTELWLRVIDEIETTENV